MKNRIWMPVFILLSGCGAVQSSLFESGKTSESESLGLFSCKAGDPPSLRPLTRLTRVQIRNTYIDLLRSRIPSLSQSDRDIMVNRMNSLVAYIPDDQNEVMRQADGTVSQAHLEGYVSYATGAADFAFAEYAPRFNLFFGNCYRQSPLRSGSQLHPATRQCVVRFLEEVGPLIWRRLLSTSEQESLIGDFQSAVFAMPNPDDNSHGQVPWVHLFVRLMSSPDFFLILDNRGTPVAPGSDVLRITPFELASRLALHFWQSGPDRQLIDRAASGVLLTDQGYAEALQYVLNHPYGRTREMVRDFAREWMSVESIPELGNQSHGLYERFRNGQLVRSHQSGQVLKTAAIEEVELMLSHFVLDAPMSTYRDLMLSDLHFSSSSALSQAYGVAPLALGEQPRVIPGGTRTGLLSRAAVLLNDGHETRPIHRGYFVRKKFLCDRVASPESAGVTVEDLQPPPFDSSKTTRERTQQKTARASCMGCHGLLNPLGFALEEFDALARHRGGSEQVLSVSAPHNVLSTLPLDLIVDPNLGSGVVGAVQGARGLASVIVDSGRGEACLARKYFTYTFRRSEDLRSDGCALQNVYNSLSHRTGGTLREMFVDVAYLPEFRHFSRRGAP